MKEIGDFKLRQLVFILTAVIFLGVSFFVAYEKNSRREKTEAEISARENQEEVRNRKFFEGLKLEARGVYVYDINTNKVLFSKNENQVFGIASITKIMTALVALDQFPETQTITISESAANSYGDIGLSAGDVWFRNDLIALMLSASSNDAAAAISEIISLEKDSIKTLELMNKKAQMFNLDSLFFESTTGLDVNGVIKAKGSAKDVAKLMSVAFVNYPEIFKTTSKLNVSKRSINGEKVTVLNTDPLVGENLNIIASKTGYTDFAGGSLVLIVEPKAGHQIAIAVLGSTFDGRFKDAKSLIKSTEKSLEFYSPK